MVGGERVARAVRRDILQPLHLDLDIHLFQEVVAELYTVKSARQDAVHPVLVHETLHETYDKPGDLLPFELGSDNAVQIQQTIGNIFRHDWQVLVRQIY